MRNEDRVPEQLALLNALWDEMREGPEIHAAGHFLSQAGVSDSAIVEWASAAAHANMPHERWQSLDQAWRGSSGQDTGYTLARYFLFSLGRGNLPRIESLPVAVEVKLRLIDLFQYVARPDREMDYLLNLQHAGFLAMCKFMRLERFPCGQFDWQVSGFPRSYLSRMPLADAPKALWSLLRAGGHAPFFETHTAFRRETPFLTPEEERSGMRLMIRSLKLQPEIKGLANASWLIDPGLFEASPHLTWLAELFREYVRFGAVWTNIGKAPPESGFLVGDRRRKKLYESGAWTPRIGFLLWLRDDMLRWLDSEEVSST